MIAVYAPTLANGYISDDLVYIEGIQRLASLAGLRDIWLHIGAIPQYYPLLHTAFWLEYRVWGLAPAGFHAMNLATHACVVLAAWRVLHRLAVPGAWLAAAIFAVHPVHVETVAWASERKILLSAALALGSIHAFLRFAEPGEPRERPRLWYALSLALYAAALLCKTVTVSVPAVLLVVRWWKTGALSRRDLRPLLPFFAVGLPLAMLTIWVEREIVGASGAAWEIGFVDRILIAGRAVCFYAAKLAWPYPLGFVYPRWDVDARAAWQYAYPLAVAAAALALWSARGRIGRGPLAALLVFVGVLFPALGFVDVYPFLFSFVADHYQYHASLAPIALAAAGIARAGTRRGRLASRVAYVAAAVILAVLGLLAHREARFYRDEETLIRRSAELQPGSWAARYLLGAVMQKEGRREEAIAEMREALRLFPEHAPIRVGLAINLAELGRRDEAAAELERVLAGELEADDRLATLLQLGDLRVAQRRIGEAEASFRAAVELAPDSPQAQYSLGLVLRELGDAPGAQAALRRSVAIQPGAAKARYALGRVLLESRDAAAAEAELREAIALEPGRADSHNLLGVALWQRAERDTAIAEFRQALALAPDHAEAARNLAHALAAEAP